MEYSETTPENRDEQQARYHRHAVLRALLSATVFGTIGALIGRWMGRHGNDPTSNLAEPMTKWSMGIFCGTLAAYSSFKASERIEKEAGRESAEHLNRQESNHHSEGPALSSSGNVPATTTHTMNATNQGTIVKSTPHVALEK